MILETERLILREMNKDDIFDLAMMLQNPKVMYAYEHDFSNDDVLDWLHRQINRYHKYGFGLWAMVLKTTNEMIGQAGLTMQPYHDSEVLEIGYLLKEKYWHQGYAIESAKACKRYAFETLKADKVYSIIKSDNEASIRVAIKNGMTKEDEFMAHYYNGDVLHYLFSVKKEI